MVKFISKKIGYFFFYFGRIRPFKQIGQSLYRFSLYILVIVLKRDKRIKAVYGLTDLGSPDFVVGKSDIDILVVINSMDVESEVEFNIYFHRLEKKLLSVFPFFGSVFDDHLYVFEDNFKLFQKHRRRYIERRGKHVKNWQLVYGVECRTDYGDDETELDGYFIRFCYEQILLAVYLGKLKEQSDIRMLYKYSFHLMRMFFFFVTKNDSDDHDDYKKFLISYGIDLAFLDTFFDLPSNNFLADDEFTILAIYSMIKIIESMAELDKSGTKDYLDFEIVKDPIFKIKIMPEINDFVNSLDKTGFKSIYLNNIIHLESYSIYLISDDTYDFNSFNKQIKNILNCLSALKTLNKKIAIKLRSSMYTITPDIFPLFITIKMINYSKFMDYGIFMESINFSVNAVKLYGESYRPKIWHQQIREADYFFNFDSYNLRMDDQLYHQQIEKIKGYYIMRHRLLVEKNKLYLTNVVDGYLSYFSDVNVDNLSNQEIYYLMRNYLKVNIN